jgi:hypothetical protein
MYQNAAYQDVPAKLSVSLIKDVSEDMLQLNILTELKVGRHVFPCCAF